MRKERFNHVTIRTPEGIVFSLRLAGPLQRCLAVILDFFIVTGITLAVALIASLIGSLGSAVSFSIMDASIAFILASSFLISTGYPILMEWLFQGQTLGKKAFGLRVMDENGLRLNFTQVMIRNLLRKVDNLPAAYLIGGATMMCSRYQQRLGDMAANTIVIQIPRESRPDLSEALGDKYNSFRDYPHLAARLRQLVGPEEASLALQGLTRRSSFNPDDRARLFSEFADHFRTLVTFPEDVQLGLSDERYVQNVVDIVYRSGTGEVLSLRPARKEDPSPEPAPATE